MYAILTFIFSVCTPNQELNVCRHQIREIADGIQFSILENPHWKHLFVIDDKDVSETLYELADRLEDKLSQCPCIGTCTKIDSCMKNEL